MGFGELHMGSQLSFFVVNDDDGEICGSFRALRGNTFLDSIRRCFRTQG